MKKIVLVSLMAALALSACKVAAPEAQTETAAKPATGPVEVNLADYAEKPATVILHDKPFGPVMAGIIPKSKQSCARVTLAAIQPLTVDADAAISAAYGSHADQWQEGFARISKAGDVDVGVVCDGEAGDPRHVLVFTTRDPNAPLDDALKGWVQGVGGAPGSMLTVFNGKTQSDRSVDAALGAESEPSGPELKPTVIEVSIQDNVFESIAGKLGVAAEFEDGIGPKQLTLNGKVLEGLIDDHVTLEKAFRVPGRDVVLVTHGCSGSACSGLIFALVELAPNTKPRLLMHRDFASVSYEDGAKVTIEPDGALLFAFTDVNGPARWRYLNGTLTRA